MKKILYILVMVVIFSGGILIGYYLISQEECLTAINNEADKESICTQEVGLEAQLSIFEREQMYTAARELIKEYSVEGMVVDLEVIKLMEKWALLSAVPLTIVTDTAQVVMEKVDNKWVAQEFGTALPEWQEKVPELFE